MAEGFNENQPKPDLTNTPYTHHVYLASDTPSDDYRRTNLVSLLTKDFGLEVSPANEKEEMDEIENGIMSSRCVVFLWTETYGQSKKSRREKRITRNRFESFKDDKFVTVLNATAGPIKDINFNNGELDYRTQNDLVHKKLHSRLFDSQLNPRQTIPLKNSIGAAYALSYFSGYLKIILRDIFQRCLEQNFVCADDDCRGSHSKCEFIMPGVYFLIIPISLEAPPELSKWDKDRICDEERKLECTREKKCNDEEVEDETKQLHCAANNECVAYMRGFMKRDYPTTVHRLTPDPTSNPNKFYRFLAEVPNNLINLKDMHLSVQFAEDLNIRLELLQFHHLLERLIEADPETRGKVRFVYCDDKESGFEEEIVKRIITLVEKEIKEQRQTPFREKVPDRDRRGSIQQVPATQEPSRHRNELDYYGLYTTDQTVGQGMVINLREGMEEEISKIKETLNRLNLDVCVEAGHDGAMQKIPLLNRYKKIFFCVILAHGENGQICTKDGSVFDFCHLVNLVRTVLPNKPIVFIVEASQSGSEYQGVNIDLKQSQTQRQESQSETQEKRSSLLPKVCDFLGYFSGPPGSKSDDTYAHEFIGSFCKHIQEKAENHVDISDILEAVTGDMTKSPASTAEKFGVQPSVTDEESNYPFAHSSLSKKVDFSEVLLQPRN